MSCNWKQFTKRIPINAPPKTIYDAWTTQFGLESWFLRLAQFTKPDGTIRTRDSSIGQGDKYKWLWFGYDDSTTEENQIITVNNWDQLQFKFSGDCIVTVSVKKEGAVTICELVQDMPTDDVVKRQQYYIECGSGWSFYMVNLKSILEGGPDLRNKNPDIRHVINA